MYRFCNKYKYFEFKLHSEKTNNDPPLKTAYITMDGETVKAQNIHLSHPLEEINSGEIDCLLGHAESFLSDKGT